jgi:hypothetical protein
LGGVREELSAAVGAGVEADHADRAGLDPAVTAAAFPGGDPETGGHSNARLGAMIAVAFRLAYLMLTRVPRWLALLARSETSG